VVWIFQECGYAAKKIALVLFAAGKANKAFCAFDDTIVLKWDALFIKAFSTALLRHQSQRASRQLRREKGCF